METREEGIGIMCDRRISLRGNMQDGCKTDGCKTSNDVWCRDMGSEESISCGNDGVKMYEWSHQARQNELYWNGQLVWPPALGHYLCVGDRGLCPAGFIAHLFAP